MADETPMSEEEAAQAAAFENASSETGGAEQIGRAHV